MAVTTNLIGFKIEGNLIAPDLTADLLVGSLKGQAVADFDPNSTLKLSDEIAIAWGDAKAFWGAFQRALARVPESDPATTVTRQQWVIPLLQSLGYEPVRLAKAEVIEGQTFEISHQAGALRGKALPEGQDHDLMPTPPVHIIGARLGLETRPPSGRPRLSAHALVQEYLNRTDHLWAIVTNGLQWRLLRDSSLMTRLTYVEFDLEQILNGENFAEFGLFYRLLHRSRLPEGMEDADDCLLEFYHQESVQQGGRVRDNLRDGVEQALKLLGTGFLQHPQSQVLREQVNTGALSAADFYRQLLLIIYRLLFLMVAEARNLLLTGGDLDSARIYREYYSLDRLRLLAEKPSSRREGYQDLWQGLRVTFLLFDENWRGQALGLSPLNGDLFGSQHLESLQAWAIDNADLLQALRCLSLYEQKGLLRRINYAALDVEELGSVYESLLDFHPQVNQLGGNWRFDLVTGSDRKTTGSYYTPPELVGQLIKSALEPVIADRLSGLGNTATTQEQALLTLKVCDPACGSGHFLLAAARRIGKELARVRTGEMQPGPEALRSSIRDVVQHCIYGVDLNPLAVDLCKVALWIEGFCGGMPLNFLDHRIKCGNSLVGVFDLEVLREGIPDDAYKPVTGDDKKLASARKKDNKSERQGQRSLFERTDFETDRAQFAELWQALGAIPEETPAQIRQKQSQYEAGRQDPRWWNDRTACNLWTAAFFTPITAEGLALVPTTAALARLLNEAQTGQRVTVSEMVAAANRLAEELRVFHWPLEFPEVFEQGGFDCVLGNPPWERIKLQEKEFFAARDYEIATAQNKAAREKLIKTLPQRKPELALEWQQAKHEAENQGVFIRESERFRLTSRGDINTYAVFSEIARNLIAGKGRSGIIVPVGIATDNTTKDFFGDLIQAQALSQLIGFENEAFIFSEVHHAFKFCVLSMTGIQQRVEQTDFMFFCRYFRQIEDQQRHFKLSPKDISLINPNTFTCPIFRSKADAEITKKIYRKVPVLENESTGQNPWGISFMRMLDMSNDSGLFQNEPGEGLLPLYEAKMFHQFDHRYSTYEGATQANLNAGILPQTTAEMKQDFDFAVMPRYWVSRSEVENRLAGKWDRKWLIAIRDITLVSNMRTCIASLFPLSASSGANLIIMKAKSQTLLLCLYSSLNSLIFDYIVRQKVGGSHLSQNYLKQLPVLPPDRYTQADINYITPRVLELTYTAWDIKPFAQDLWNPTPSQPPQQPAPTPDQGLLSSLSEKQQLSLGLDISAPKQQLQIPAPSPTHTNQSDLIELRQRFLDQWQANRQSLTPQPPLPKGEEEPEPAQNPSPPGRGAGVRETPVLDPTTDELPIPPFVWNEDRRAILRAELDAYYAHLYGLTRDELRYILDPADVYGPDFPSETFRVLKNNEIKKYGEYRTQRLVLEAWDALGF